MRHLKLIFFTAIILSAFLSPLLGQSPFLFHHLTTENGLSNNYVMSILNDRYGFLWIGTESGLNRYDGYNFKKYTAKSGVLNSLSSNMILNLQEDGLGNLWIQTGVSYVIYNREKDCFNGDIPAFLNDLGIQVGSVYEVYVDKKKDLWIISTPHVYCFNTTTKTLKVFTISHWFEGLTPNNIGDDGECLYGIIKSGAIVQLSKSTGNQKIIELPDYVNKEIQNKSNSIYVDSHNGFWLYSRIADIIYYKKDPNSEWKKLFLNSSIKAQNNIVKAIMDDDNGHVWIGTDHNGTFIYDKANDTFTNYLNDLSKKSSIASNNVVCIYKDDNGVVWLGHNKKGISYYHHSFYSLIRIENPDCRDVSVILEDKKGRIWLGTDGYGLFMREKAQGGKILKQPLPNNAIVSLLEDRKGRIWIGTYLNGLFSYDNGKYTHYTKDNSKLSINDIWRLTEDRYGNLWIVPLGGGIQFLPAGSNSLDSLKNINADMAYTLDMYYDGGDKLFIGTAYGLVIYDIITAKTQTYFGNKRGTQNFNQLAIPTVYKDKMDNIWLGQVEGLTIWDTKNDSLYFLNKDNGLCDNIIRGIVEDDYQNIWVTTSNGVSVIVKNRNSQGNLKMTIKNFSTKDGLMDNYFNNHSICKLRDGDILLGGTEGYTIVNPNKIVERNKPLANVVFTGLSISKKSILIDSLYNGQKILKQPVEQTTSVTLNYNDKLISLQFAAGDLLNADKVNYVYKLEGFNNQWLPTQGNTIEFSSLAPGNYKLFLKARNSDGIWNDEATCLNITVTPPFYLSGWALTLYYFFVFSIILFIIYRTRKNHKKKLEQQKLQLEHEQEKNLNEMKLRFFTNISHDLRTPLTLIITPLQTILNGEMTEGLRNKLISINKNAEQLLHLINSLLDFRKLDKGADSLHLQIGDFVNFIRGVCAPFHSYASDRNMNFTISSEIESLSMKFDPTKTKKILFNLLSNAFKYTPDNGKISINLTIEHDYVCVSVSDTGMGINETDKQHVFERFYQASQNQEKTGSGIGLHIVNEYVLMHEGSIEITDNKPKGSIFTFKLPIREISSYEEIKPEDGVDEAEVIEFDENIIIPEKPLLLFVDDNKDLCVFMAESLSDEYTVHLSHNGQEALEQLSIKDFDVVVSDIMMPVMNGIELCNQIKTSIYWSHIPVILLTARTADEYKIEALELGADDYITKPFNFNLLKLRIRKFLEWREKCHLSFSQKMDVSPSEITITSLDEQLIEKAIRFVEEHISEAEFSVEELSEAVGLSRSHLYKKLMSITGKGPSEFIRTIRLKRGRQLLEKSQLQIAEIAYIVGFNSPKRFTINFKNEFGISPSEYLRNLSK